jgi:pyruvate,water dikinase
MASANAALDLWRLAAWARERDTVVGALAARVPYPKLRARLLASADGRAFVERWDAFRHRHGHHARGELDAFNPRWSETPDELLDLLRHYLELPEGFNPIAEQAQRRTEREALLADCRRKLRPPWKRWLLGYLVRRGQRGLAFRENVKSEAVRSVALLRAALLEAGRRLETRGVLARAGDVFFLEFEELERTLRGQPMAGIAGTVAARQAERARLEAIHPPSIVVGDFHPADPPARSGSSVNGELHGLGVSPGCATGRARVIAAGEARARVLPGEILVAPCTDPGWTPLFLTAAGIVADIGGQLSHGSIIAREYSIPAVVNVGHATQIIQTGQMIEVDGDRGVVRVV